MQLLIPTLAKFSVVLAAFTTEPIVEPQQLAARQNVPVDGTALFCSMPGYSPECAHVGYYSFICLPMPFDLRQTLQSAKLLDPANDAGKCVFYRDIDCTGGSSQEVPASGIDNFQAHGIYGPWQGFYCWNGTLPGDIEGAPKSAKPEQIKRAHIPVDKRTPQPKRADGFFYYCSLPGFAGTCETTPYLSKQCMPVPESFNGAVQAATPVVNYNTACFVYHDENCQGDHTQALVYPGDSNFQTHGNYGFWKSWYCDCGEACPNKNHQRSDDINALVDKDTLVEMFSSRPGIGRRGA